jgi:hypothetical protein
MRLAQASAPSTKPQKPLRAAIIAAVLFAAGFVAWNYYPHDFGLPIIKTIEMDGGPG